MYIYYFKLCFWSIFIIGILHCHKGHINTVLRANYVLINVWFISVKYKIFTMWSKRCVIEVSPQNWRILGTVSYILKVRGERIYTKFMIYVSLALILKKTNPLSSPAWLPHIIFAPGLLLFLLIPDWCSVMLLLVDGAEGLLDTVLSSPWTTPTPCQLGPCDSLTELFSSNPHAEIYSLGDFLKQILCALQNDKKN